MQRKGEVPADPAVLQAHGQLNATQVNLGVLCVDPAYTTRCPSLQGPSPHPARPLEAVCAAKAARKTTLKFWAAGRRNYNIPDHGSSESVAGAYTEIPSTLATDLSSGTHCGDFGCDPRRKDTSRHVSRPARLLGRVSEDAEDPPDCRGNNIWPCRNSPRAKGSSTGG